MGSESSLLPHPVVSVVSLSAGYSGFTVVHDVSVEVSSSQILTVLGPNGSGKSTLCKSVLSLAAKHGGTVVLDGQDITAKPTHEISNAGVAYISQVEDVFPSLTVAENIEIPCLSRSAPLKETMDYVYEKLPQLYPLRHRHASHLSGGERRMVSIGRALAARPRLLIADEPSSNLAPALAEGLWKHLRSIADDGVAVFAVEQNVGLALKYTDAVCVLVEGRMRLPRTEASALDLESVFEIFTDQRTAEAHGINSTCTAVTKPTA